MSIWGKPVMMGGSGGGGSLVNRTLQNSLLNSAVYTKEGYIGAFDGSIAYWQPYNTSGSALDVNWSQPWKLHCKFKFSQVDSRSEALFGTKSFNEYWKGTLSMEAQPSTWFFPFSTDGSQWTDSATISHSEVPYTASVDYIMDITYDGTSIVITLSDGTNSATKTITPASALYYHSTYKFAFGNVGQNNDLYARYAYFDPNDCYIESNGVRVWGSSATGGGGGGGGTLWILNPDIMDAQAAASPYVSNIDSSTSSTTPVYYSPTITYAPVVVKINQFSYTNPRMDWLSQKGNYGGVSNKAFLGRYGYDRAGIFFAVKIPAATYSTLHIQFEITSGAFPYPHFQAYLVKSMTYSNDVYPADSEILYTKSMAEDVISDNEQTIDVSSIAQDFYLAFVDWSGFVKLRSIYLT